MNAPVATDFYLNFNRFTEMKQGARKHSAATSQAAAQQFESLFIQQMLAAMRSAASIDDSEKSSYSGFYEEIHDKQMALLMAQKGGLGVAKMITRQLPMDKPEAVNTDLHLLTAESRLHLNQVVNTESSAYQAENSALVVHRLMDDDIHIPTTDATPHPRTEWHNSLEFIQDIGSQAQASAQNLGVSPGLLVAQSALETGWGKHVMKHPDGRSSFNLFGIKAGSNWQGDTVTKSTQEFRHGRMQTETAHFRAYASVRESLDDYVNLIQSQPRYQPALNHDGSDQHYLYALQKAGYATDPEYADKILAILQGDKLQEALASLHQTRGLNNA